MPEQLTVPRLDKPDVAEFRRRFEKPGLPVVITGAMKTWKALQHWSIEYFAEHFGSEHLRVMTIGEELPADGPITTEQVKRVKVTKVTMRDFMCDISSGKPLRYYVAGMPLQSDLPMLIDDIEMPVYRERGSAASPRIWLGARVYGPLHYDQSDNLHGIVYGGKRFTLLPPSQLPYLYPCSMFSTIPHMSRASLSKPDYVTFPRLRKARPITVDLGPGDFLYLPAGWWHQVATPSPTISIDFPWQKDREIGRPFFRLIPYRVLRHVRGRMGYVK